MRQSIPRQAASSRWQRGFGAASDREQSTNRLSSPLKLNDGRLEHAQQMAGHESPRTTKLYDRTKEEITLSEVERIRLWHSNGRIRSNFQQHWQKPRVGKPVLWWCGLMG